MLFSDFYPLPAPRIVSFGEKREVSSIDVIVHKDESRIRIAAYKEPRFAFPMGHRGAIRGGMGSKKKKKVDHYPLGSASVVLPDATSFAARSPHSSAAIIEYSVRCWTLRATAVLKPIRVWARDPIAYQLLRRFVHKGGRLMRCPDINRNNRLSCNSYHPLPASWLSVVATRIIQPILPSLAIYKTDRFDRESGRWNCPMDEFCPTWNRTFGTKTRERSFEKKRKKNRRHRNVFLSRTSAHHAIAS